MTSLVDAFDAAVLRFGERPAVTDGRRTLTYRQVAEMAAAMAGRLGPRARGAAVGIVSERSIESVVAMVAVLQAGAYFVPVDPAWPKVRQEQLLEDAGVVAVLDTDDSRLLRRTGGSAPRTGPAGDDLAYLIFTSGSTGRPKGVEIEHKAVLHLVSAFHKCFAMDTRDRVLHCSSIGFDVAIWEVFTPLTCGACVCVATRETVLAPAELSALIVDAGVTIVDVLPAVLDALDPSEFPRLRIAMTGIEPVPAQVVDDWSTGNRVVFNGYGPTEAAVICMLMKCVPGSGPPPIGYPLGRMTAAVVDAGARLCPRGEIGELWVAGPQLARGYLGGVTGGFVDEAIGDGPRRRWYRTGDRVYARDDGAMMFCGREDDQIKIRGYRVEPLEIEAIARSVEGASEAVVTVDRQPGGPTVVLWVGSEDTPSVVRRRLAGAAEGLLPSHLRPSRIEILPRLPRLSNGKVDRRALGSQMPSGPELASPGLDADGPALAICREVLGRPDLGPTELLLDRGLDSLAAMRIAGRLRRGPGLPLTAADVLQASTAADLDRAVLEGV